MPSIYPPPRPKYDDGGHRPTAGELRDALYLVREISDAKRARGDFDPPPMHRHRFVLTVT